MEYISIIDTEKLTKLKEEEKFLEASRMLIEDVKHNYLKKTDDPLLTEIYNSISYIGIENGLFNEQTFKHITFLREGFIKIFNSL